MECKYRQKFGIIKKYKNLNPFVNSKEYKFWDFTWIEIILPRLDKNIDKDNLIKFWNANIGKKFGIIKNNKNLNPFVNSKEYKFWDFTWIEIILPRSYKNIDIDINFIKLWNANIGKNLGL